MEFLVDMVTTVPDGATDADVGAIRAREAARSQELAAQGHLLRLWRPPLGAGEWRTWGLFRAADATGLESVLSSMPLRVWRHDTVTPLTEHPSDPGRGGGQGSLTSPARRTCSTRSSPGGRRRSMPMSRDRSPRCSRRTRSSRACIPTPWGRPGSPGSTPPSRRA